MGLPLPLFVPHELAFRTQYAELKERSRQAGTLLPGSPGTLYLRKGTGSAYWYRVYYTIPGKQAETLVCKEGDDTTLNEMQERMQFASWLATQVTALRKLGFQVADKAVARVLLELHNQGAFDAGLVLVGTLAYMAWLNELGAIAVAARTQDIDLARGQKLKLAVPRAFLDTLQATGLPFVAAPRLPSTQPSTSIKLPGVQGLRVDVLAHGKTLGQVIQIPELAWAAQSVPYYDYLLEDPEPAALLAGGHCIPLRLPQVARLIWHKLYSASERRGFPERAVKDRLQAATLAAALTAHEPEALRAAFRLAPKKIQAAARAQRNQLEKLLDKHEETQTLIAAAMN